MKVFSQALRQRDRSFKCYHNENIPHPLKMAKCNKYKNAWSLVIFKVKSRKKNIIRIIYNSIKRCQKHGMPSDQL